MQHLPLHRSCSRATDQETANTGTVRAPLQSRARLTTLRETLSGLEKEYADLTKASTTAAGVVLIFDAADGGMVAATLPLLRDWKDGTLSDEALWRRCYIDPPEMFRGAAGQ